MAVVAVVAAGWVGGLPFSAAAADREDAVMTTIASLDRAITVDAHQRPVVPLGEIVEACHDPHFLARQGGDARWAGRGAGRRREDQRHRRIQYCTSVVRGKLFQQVEGFLSRDGPVNFCALCELESTALPDHKVGAVGFLCGCAPA